MEDRYFEDQIFKEIKLDGELLSDYEFIDCVFYDCSLENCKLIRCLFTGCKFEKCTAANLTTESSSIQYAEFSDCYMAGINWGVLLPPGRFATPIQKMQSCHLKYNTFTNMAFRKLQFSDTAVTDSLFGECELTACSFRKCKLERTEFFKCDLQKTDFREATGYEIDILTCKIKGASFSLPEAITLLNCLAVKIE